MDTTLSKDYIFRREEPTAFVVNSPLQLLCAIEAIHELEISTYHLVLMLTPNEPRIAQFLSMANLYHLQYETIYSNEVNYYDLQNKYGYFKDFDETPKFKRIFIGDYYQISQYYIAYKFADKDCLIFYGDDGNDSISYFQEKSIDPKFFRWDHKLLALITGNNDREASRTAISNYLKTKEVFCTNAFFTSFYNINNPKFILYPNNFKYISSLSANNKEEVIVIVGSIMNNIPVIYNIEESVAENILYKKMKEVKESYVNEKIIFIPHGRDISETIPEFCRNLGIEYKKIPESIEGYILKSHFCPIAVYGEGSTALYNLHLLFPKSKVVNWVFKKPQNNPKFHIVMRIADYYKNNGIINDYVSFPNISAFKLFCEKINIKGLCHALLLALKILIRKLLYSFCHIHNKDNVK